MFFKADRLSEILDGYKYQVERNFIRQMTDQLNDLIERDLLVIKQLPICLIRKQDENKIEVRSTVSLTLKDMDYVRKLEEDIDKLKFENDRLTNLLAEINNVVINKGK